LLQERYNTILIQGIRGMCQARVRRVFRLVYLIYLISRNKNNRNKWLFGDQNVYPLRTYRGPHQRGRILPRVTLEKVLA